jgi:hypothetical protein
MSDVIDAINTLTVVVALDGVAVTIALLVVGFRDHR